MNAAARTATALPFVLLAIVLSPVRVGAQSPPPASPDDLLLPFSSSLNLPVGATQGPVRLKHLVERLDAVSKADVQLSGSADHPQVLVLVTWRTPDAAVDRAVDLIVSLAFRTIPGLAAAGLTVADSSGVVRYDGRPRPPAARQASGSFWSSSTVVIVVSAAILVLALLHFTTYLGRPRAAQEAPCRIPSSLAGQSVRDLALLLRSASPAVRGAVLASLPEKLRHRLARTLGGRVDWPERAPDPPVLAAVLDALRSTGGSQ